MTVDAVTYSILIASIGRRTLLRTVESARRAGLASGALFEIVVADDSADRAAAQLLASIPPIPELVIVISAARNISKARNAAVEAARGDYLAFVDDDEWVPDDWLLAHRSVMDRSGADATFGSVQAHYPAGAPAWLRWSDPLSKWPGPSLWNVKRLSTCNCLVRRSAFFDHGLRFDPALGRSGGEDADLFSRLRASGGRLASAPEARIDEEIMIERCNARDIWRRALRMGQTYGLREIAGAPYRQRLSFFLSSLVRTCASIAMSIGYLVIGKKRGVALILVAGMNVGKMRAVLGLPVAQYY
jgi:succinoglycan biosynthesis protein ExoM